jgi:5'-3' exonuclease
MGVPRFFQHILKVYPEACSRFAYTSKLKFPVIVDALYVDANGIIHNCVRDVYFEKPKPQRLAPNVFDDDDLDDTINPPKQPPAVGAREPLVYKKICEYIDQLIKFVNPTKLVYIAIDGTAPIAKQAQQRQRRYRSAYEKSEADFNTFDTCAITPGTEFSMNLSKYMTKHYSKKVSNRNNRSNGVEAPANHRRRGAGAPSAGAPPTIIFSDSSVPGEGEHNCIEAIRNNPDPDYRHCIYGLDADLFMLALASHKEHIHLLREDIFAQTFQPAPAVGSTKSPPSEALDTTTFYLCDIHVLRDSFYSKWGAETTIRNRLIDDFVFLCYFLGNDFLHMSPFVGQLHDTIMLMLEIRKFALGYDRYLTDGAKINIHELTLFLTDFAKYEPSLLSNQYFMDFKYPRVTLNNALEDPMNPRKGVSIAKFRQGHYTKAGITDPRDIPKFCKDYLEGLEWVNWYYHHPPINWRYLYKHHYTPLLADIAAYLRHFKDAPFERVSQIKTASNKPFEQLMCVIPPRSMALLPKELRGIYTTPNLVKYYPTKFEIDREGKMMDWEGTVLLPFIDIDDIIAFYNKVKTSELEDHPQNKDGSIKSW